MKTIVYHIVNNMYMNIIHEWLPQIHFCAYASLTDFVPIGAPLKQFIDSELSMPDLRLSPLNNNHNLVMFFFLIIQVDFLISKSLLTKKLHS